MTQGEDFRRVFESALEAQLLLDPGGVVVSVSDGYLGVTGMERGSVVGCSVSALPPYDEAPIAAAHLEESLRTLRRVPVPVPNAMPDIVPTRSGTLFARGSSLPIMNAEGALVRIVHRLEGASSGDGQSERDRRFRKLVEQSYDAILLADSQGQVTFASPAVERITGYTPQEFLARPAALDVHPDDANRIGEEIREVFTKPLGASLMRTRRRHKDGVYRTVEFTVVNHLHDPDVGALVVNLRDVSEQVTLEQNLRESQKLESLGVLAGGIAHDFNNLLSTILGNVTLMAEEFAEQPRALSSLSQVETAARRAADLCKQMLAYCGKASYARTHTDLDALIEETTQLLRVSISKKVDLRFQVQPDLPSISADPTQVQQVLINLILNASEALGPAAGSIGVRARVRDVDRGFLRQAMFSSNLPEGRYVLLEVTDDGPGIPVEARDRIFEPFFSTKGAGRGLGLAAVQGIVRGHGGALRVESEPGKGTTFQLLFPLVAPKHESEAPVSSQRVSLQGAGTILLVEDEPALRAVQARMIARLGHRVIEAADGQQAVEIYGERCREIAGVLMDLTMPKMSGEEAFREMIKINPAVRVLLMSGYSKSGETARLISEGLVGFMPKPFAFRELQRQLEALTQRRNAV